MNTQYELPSKRFFKLDFKHFFRYIALFMREQVVLVLASLAALITCFFVPIDAAYLGYFDFRTLACLFCTLAVVGAFKNIYVFEIIAQKIIERFHTLRNVILGIVFITFFGSMLLANDMALLTFLPLGFLVLDQTNKKNYMAFTFIMQNIAANLGGMLTPFGNPQNLYLYSYFQIPTSEFFQIMWIPFISATVLIIVCCLFVKSEPLKLVHHTEYTINPTRTSIYALLFLLSIGIVFRIVSYILGTILITFILMLLDKKALKSVNYPLLLTFCMFFVFSGNMARIPYVKQVFESILPLNPLLVGVVSCQFISNVPSAILLSRFTIDYPNLLVAVNIGGLGTLIASLASLITFSEFKKNNPKDIKKYLCMFLGINFSFLIILYMIQTLTA